MCYELERKGCGNIGSVGWIQMSNMEKRDPIYVDLKAEGNSVRKGFWGGRQDSGKDTGKQRQKGGALKRMCGR